MTTKAQARAEFRKGWSKLIRQYPEFRGNKSSERMAWNEYVMRLGRNDLITNVQMHKWLIPNEYGLTPLMNEQSRSNPHGMTKTQSRARSSTVKTRAARAQFREYWAERVMDDPRLRNDVHARREAWNAFVDLLLDTSAFPET